MKGADQRLWGGEGVQTEKGAEEVKSEWRGGGEMPSLEPFPFFLRHYILSSTHHNYFYHALVNS